VSINFEDNPASIKYHVKKYIFSNIDNIKGKTIVDLPAGNGVTTRILQSVGGDPIPIDLFPEYFKVENLDCIKADINEGLPLNSESADMVICQEGIEHFENQYKSFREFNRILKLNGTLLISTPNYSNLRSKMSYFLSESERYNKMMPPNEIDSIWMNPKTCDKKIYLGHVFLTGILKLRLFGVLSGFKIRKIHFVRFSFSSFVFFLFTYPFIVISNVINLLKNRKKIKPGISQNKQTTYFEIFKLCINPQILIDKHLFVEFEKVCNTEEVSEKLNSVYKEFGIT